jgi:hypothetical protein
MSAPLVWPTLAQKEHILRKLNVALYPAQQQASAALTGPRDVPRTVQIIGGERAGKSAFCGHEAATLVPWCDLIYIVGANYENAEPEFTYLTDDLLALGLLERSAISKPKEGQWSATVAGLGTRIETLSMSRLGADALTTTGKAPDLVIISEAGMVDEAHFTAAYTRAAERRGAVLLAGTLKRSRPWYVALYRTLQSTPNKWHGSSHSFPSWQNASIYPRGEADPTIQAMRAALGETLFAERLGAVPVPSPLLVFGREFDYATHVRDIAYDPAYPLWLAVDPGYAGAYALLVCQAPSSSDIRIIAEYYQQYATWDKAVAWLRAQPFTQQRGSLIVNVERAVMDVAGAQHHADRSQMEQWADATGIRFRAEPVGIDLGISRLRDFLRSPFAWDVARIHIAPTCEGLIWELQEGEQYPRDQEGQPIRERPLDANNHSRKALSYLLVNAYGRGEHDTRPANVAGNVTHTHATQDVTLVPGPGGTVRFVHRPGYARARTLHFTR